MANTFNILLAIKIYLINCCISCSLLNKCFLSFYQIQEENTNGLFPNYGCADPLPLRSGHLDIKDAQCANKNDGRKISYRVSALGPI